MKTYFSRIEYLRETYSWNELSKEELSNLLIEAINQPVIINNRYCDSQKKACRSSAINEYTQDVLGCAGAGALITGVSGGLLALLGGAVTVGCIRQAAYNLSVQIDLCT